MNFWRRLPIAVVIASILTGVAYLAPVGLGQAGSWGVAATIALLLAALFGLLFVVFVVPTAIVLKLLQAGPLLSSVVIVALCVVIDLYLYVVHYRMPLGDNIGGYLYGAAGIGLVGGLVYAGVQYLTLPSIGPRSRSRGAQPVKAALDSDKGK